MGIRSRIISALLPPGAPSVGDEERYSFSDWITEAIQYSFNGNNYVLPVTQQPGQGEQIENDFLQYVSRVYKRNGPVFAVIQTRINLLSEVRFKYRNLVTKDLHGDPSLLLLEHPWPNGTTGELIARMEQDVSLAGNFYGWVRPAVNGQPARIRRLSPEKVKIVLASTAQEADDVNDLNSEVRGYAYYPDGFGKLGTGIGIPVDEMIHWSPIPDPSAMYRGMSWLTPVIREVQSDGSSVDATQKFFDNGMTPNMVIKFPESVMTEAKFKELRDAMDSSHAGVRNAFKTLYLAAGADATVVGADLKTAGLKEVQAAGETRICAAGRVPPVIVGLSEGLQAATYSNYGQARRQFADGFARPQWRSMCAALSKAVMIPSGSELWYDERDVAFLREDAKEAADTTTTHAAAVVTLVNGGFDSDSAVKAVVSGDLALLKHTGLVSVQLQEPGALDAAAAPDTAAPPDSPPPAK